MRSEKRARLGALVESVILRKRLFEVARGAAAAFIVAMTGTLAFAVYNSFAPLRTAHVEAARYIIAAASGAIAFYYAVFRAAAALPPGRVASDLGGVRTESDFLAAAIELDETSVAKYGYSEELCDATADRAFDRFGEASAADFVPASALLRHLAAAAILLVSLAAVASTQTGFRAIARLWPAAAAVFLPAPAEIASDNLDFTAFAGEDVTLSFTSRRGEDADIFIRHTDETVKSPSFNFEDDDEASGNPDISVYRLARAADTSEAGLFRYHMTFQGQGRNFYYAARSPVSGSRSKVYFCRMARRPEIPKLNASYDFPEYTRLARMTEDNVSSISALYGTRVTLAGRATKPLKSALIRFADGQPVNMDISAGGRAVSGTFTVVRNTGYSIEATDTEGFENRRGRPGEIRVYSDNFPACDIIEPRGEINCPAERKVEITAKASDDFGISQMRLVSFRNEGEEDSFEIELHEKNAGETMQKCVLDLSGAAAKPGQSVYYYVAVWDNDVISGPKMSKSNVQKISFPSEFDEAVEIDKLQESIENRLNRIADEQKKISEKVAELSELQKQKLLNEFETRKNFENLAKRQENLINETRELSQDLKDAVKKMENNPYIKPETLAKIAEIQQEVEKMLSEEMKQAMMDMNKNVEKMKLTGEDVKKFSASFDEKKLLEKFERLKELFQKAEREQKLGTFTKELETILGRQEMVMENTEKSSPEVRELNEELASEQKSIGENFDRAFEKFEKDMGAIGEISEGVKDSAEEVASDLKGEKVSEKMKRSGDDLSRMNPKNAFGEQKKVAESLKKAIQKLKDSFDEFKKKNKDELKNALSKLIEKSVAMSRFQEEIQKGFIDAMGLRRPETMEMYTQTLDAIAEKCIENSNAARAMVGELMELSKKSVLIDIGHVSRAGLIARLFSVMKPMLAEREIVNSSNVGNQVYMNINIMTLMLIDILDMVNDAKSGSNMDQLMSMLKKQAEAQARLNAKTKSMMGQTGPDGMPRLSPEALKSLAFEQQLIRRSMERIMEGMDPNGEMAKRLREIKDEMQSLEGELFRKQVDRKLESRQKILHERLLEMQKALFKEKETTERKAEAAKKYEIRTPAGRPATQEVKKGELRIEDSLKNEKYPRSYEKIIEMYLNAIQKI